MLVLAFNQLVQEGIPRNETDIIRGTTTPNEKGKQERIGFRWTYHERTAGQTKRGQTAMRVRRGSEPPVLLKDSD